MAMIEQLIRERVAAYKAGDKAKATLLATLIGEARADARKDAVREPTDEELQAKIRKFIKNNEETIFRAGAEKAAPLEAENRILETYLPRMLDDDALRARLQPVVDALPDKSPKAMGQVMARIKGDPQIDMKRAAAIVKQLLSG